MRYFIRTFGCQMNKAESERMAAVLEQQGHQIVTKIDKADVVVINTCSVRESAENRVVGLINNLAKKKGKKQRIILTGCMVGSATGQRRRYSLKALKRRLPQVDEFKTTEELVGELKQGFPSAHQAPAVKDTWVPIMKGCNQFCTYCVVPYARGRERSRPFEEVVREVEYLVNKGYRHITLLGQNVNTYGKDFSQAYLNKLSSLYHISICDVKAPFAWLLRLLHQIKGISKISFVTSNPWDLTSEIIEAMKLPKIDRSLHLPVQSGDDEVLRRMNRPYTARDYIKLVKKIRREIPGIKISTDIIVGFPGETKKAFENTVKLCQKVGFERAYIARYSPRPGTAAYQLKDDVSDKEKKRRWQILDTLINRSAQFKTKPKLQVTSQS